MGGPRHHAAGAAGWTDILSLATKSKAKAFKTISPELSYAECVTKAKALEGGSKGKGGDGGKGGGKGNKGKGGDKGNSSGTGKGGGKGKGSYDDSKKGGQRVECPSEKCKGFMHSSHMPRDCVTCSLCNSLYPRELLSEEQQKHWDAVAKSRGATDFAQDDDDMWLDEDQDGAEEGGLELEQGEEKQTLEELKASLVQAEAALENATTNLVLFLDTADHGTLCNKLLGVVNRIKERIKAAGTAGNEDAAWQLNKELQGHLVQSKAEKARLAKWETKATDLEREAKEARIHAQVCKDNDAAIQAKVLVITQQLAQLASGQPPPAEPLEATADQKEAETARHQEVQDYVAEALKQQRTEMLAEFQVMWHNAATAHLTAATNPGTAEGAPAAGSEAAPPDPIKKMGEDFKKKSAGLAATAATSVVKASINKEKGRIRKKEETKKLLTGKAAEASAESEALATRVEEQLKEDSNL